MRLPLGLVLLVIIIAAFYAYSVMGSEGFVFFGEPAPGKPKVPRERYSPPWWPCCSG